MSNIIDSLAHKPEHPQAAQIFRQVGVEFPPGSGTFWNSTTGELIVRNTLGNLNQIQNFLEGLRPERTP